MGFQLWIEERDKAVWHLATERLTPRTYRVACGWQMTRDDSTIYPQKPHEPGPPEAQRCHSCLAEAPAAIQIEIPTPAGRKSD